MIANGIASGHVLAADWLFLIAFVLFVVAFVINWVGGTIAAKVNPLSLLFAGLALVAVAWLVL